MNVFPASITIVLALMQTWEDVGRKTPSVTYKLTGFHQQHWFKAQWRIDDTILRYDAAFLTLR